MLAVESGNRNATKTANRDAQARNERTPKPCITDKNGIASYALQRRRRLERRLRQGKTSLRIMKICVPGSVRVGVRRDCLRLRTGPPILGQAAAIIVIATV